MLAGLLALGAGSAAGPGAAQAAGPVGAIAVVVGRDRAPEAPLRRTLVAGIFGRKRLLWDDRRPIAAVNLPAADPVRRAFSMRVFGRPPEDLQDYWNDLYFHGVLPPPVLASEEAVMRFVASTPGAIGYVAACRVDARVVVVATLPGPEGADADACPR